MSVKNFKFVSPGVQVQEIDNSALPRSPGQPGPVVIGRARRGPAMRPVVVNSFSEFIENFGNPVAGGQGGDVWRNGNMSSPMYGTYAAQAYLKNSSPLTYVRLLGVEDPNESTSGGAGAAGWKESMDTAGTAGGGAMGLVLFNSGSTGLLHQDNGEIRLTGALAAVIYVEDANTMLRLSGTCLAVTGTSGGPKNGLGSQLIVRNSGGSREYVVAITAEDGSSKNITSSFNFTTDSSKYIRKVLNTNPQLTNGTITDASAQKGYWLGETFDRSVATHITSSDSFASLVWLYRDAGGTAADGGNHKNAMVAGQTPWVIANDPVQGIADVSTNWNPKDRQKLFKFHALTPGDWSNRNMKVSIANIKAPQNDSTPYGTFSVIVRQLGDSDNVVQVLERYDNCDLNPNSLNYVARKVGDENIVWDNAKRRYNVQDGNWPSRSNLIRIEMNTDVDAGLTDGGLLPFGMRGMITYADLITTGTEAGADGGRLKARAWLTGSAWGAPTYIGGAAAAHPRGSGKSAGDDLTLLWMYDSGSTTAGADTYLRAKVITPNPSLRVSASDGDLGNPTDAYFGYQTGRSNTSTRFDPSNADLLRPRGGMLNTFSSGSWMKETTVFTLDDLREGANDAVWWESGSHAAGKSLTVISGAVSGVLDAGYDRFTMPMYGGFSGLDIKEMDPFRNTLLLNGTPRTNYAFASVKRAIDSIAEPEVVDIDLALVPGVTNEGLTNHLINVCEDRADALAIIDLPGGFVPRAESTSESRNATTGVKTTVDNLRNRGISTSYACAFFPWVRARDGITGANVFMPPSVAALGTFSSSQRKTAPWFAPAGFNRGGLTEGAAGIPVVGVSQQLSKADRDKLYAANINPIAKFPAEGIVVFGQKTLQVTPSALDRINVRRMLLFVKKKIARVSTQVLFDPNVEVTWNRFKSLARPILDGVKDNFGLSEYRLVLDSSTTTPELVDRNIMYAQIFLKPTRAIEFIAIDFNVQRTGAAFDD